MKRTEESAPTRRDSFWWRRPETRPEVVANGSALLILLAFAVVSNAVDNAVVFVVSGVLLFACYWAIIQFGPRRLAHAGPKITTAVFCVEASLIAACWPLYLLSTRSNSGSETAIFLGIAAALVGILAWDFYRKSK